VHKFNMFGLGLLSIELIFRRLYIELG